MIVLGISGGHDANWCVVDDGKLLGAFEKERFTGERHAAGRVVDLIPASLAYLNLTIDDIDLVATSEPVHRGTGSGLRRISGRTYESLDDWQHQVVELAGRILPAVSIPHHVAHAAYARYTSRFTETAAITWDGGGDFYTVDAYSSTTVSWWTGNRLSWIERVPNSDFGSLWFTYSRVVFGDPDVAGKLMGLASFGTPDLVDAMRSRFTVTQRGTFADAQTIKNCWPDYDQPPFTAADVSWRSRRGPDIAYAVQALTTESGLSLARKVRQVTKADNLVLSGGVALNGYLNTAVRREAGFRDVFIPPAVDDGGLSVGCALFAYHHIQDAPLPADGDDVNWATVGMGYSTADAAGALDRHDIAHRPADRAEAIDLATKKVAAGQVVAWFEGRSEHGPRALGSRSLLSAVHSDTFRRRLNAEIKFREEFRPIAPVVPAGRAADYFDIDWDSPYMMYIVPVTDRGVAECPAAVHVDATARVQTVAPDSSLGLIAAGMERHGLAPVIVNTSFNVRGPIVNSPDHAIETFMRSPVDVLYLEGHLVER